VNTNIRGNPLLLNRTPEHDQGHVQKVMGLADLSPQTAEVTVAFRSFFISFFSFHCLSFFLFFHFIHFVLFFIGLSDLRVGDHKFATTRTTGQCGKIIDHVTMRNAEDRRCKEYTSKT
jgi:hypothetical protein